MSARFSLAKSGHDRNSKSCGVCCNTASHNSGNVRSKERTISGYGRPVVQGYNRYLFWISGFVPPFQLTCLEEVLEFEICIWQ